MDSIALATVILTGGAFVVYGIQAALMRQTLVTSSRPYVNAVEIVPTPLRENSEGPVSHWRFAVKLENAGSTPIKRAIMVTNSRFSDRRIDEKAFTYPNESIAGEDFISPVSLGPKSVIPGTKIAVNVEDLSLVGRKEKALYIWGWIDYDDGFWLSKRHRTEFAFEIAVRADPLNPEARPFHMPRLWHHNGADEDSFREPVSYDAALRGELGPIRKQHRQALPKPRHSQDS